MKFLETLILTKVFIVIHKIGYKQNKAKYFLLEISFDQLRYFHHEKGYEVASKRTILFMKSV